MRRASPTRVSAVLSREHNVLGPMLDKARRLEEINHLLWKRMDDDLAKHCRIANISSERLVLEADSSAWSARLRFRVPEILTHLQERGIISGSCSTHIYISAGHPAPLTNKFPKPALSQANSELLRTVARTVTDIPLREVLLRLAAHCCAKTRQDD